MPKDNIDRAIKKGVGELDGGEFFELLYEGYGTSGVAVLCEILTDNRNRTAGELRKIFESGGGSLGQSGCVAWIFERKGLFLVDSKTIAEDQLLEIALEAGADDLKEIDGMYEITCAPGSFQDVRLALEKSDIICEVSELSRVPANTVDLNAQSGKKILRLLEVLDEHEDVQNVFANFNIPESAMAEMVSNPG